MALYPFHSIQIIKLTMIHSTTIPFVSFYFYITLHLLHMHSSNAGCIRMATCCVYARKARKKRVSLTIELMRIWEIDSTTLLACLSLFHLPFRWKWKGCVYSTDSIMCVSINRERDWWRYISVWIGFWCQIVYVATLHNHFILQISNFQPHTFFIGRLFFCFW